MTDKKRFFGNGLILTAVAVATRTAALFFGAFVSRTVGAGGVGLFSLIMTVYGFAAAFATSGIGLTVTRLVAASEERGGEETPGILRAAVLYTSGFSLAASAVLFFFATPLAGGVVGDAACASSLAMLSLSLVPTGIVAVISGYFVGVGRVSNNAAAQVLTQCAKIGAARLLFAGKEGASAQDACLTLATVSVITDIVTLLVLGVQFLRDRRRHRQNRPSLHSHVKEVFTTAVPLGVSVYIRSALLSVEHLLIPRSLRKSGLGAADALSGYGILGGMVLPLILWPMAPLSSFAGLLVPEFAAMGVAGNQKRTDRIATRAVEATLIYGFSVAAFCFFFAEDLGAAFYRSLPAGKLIAALSPVIPVMYLDHVTDACLKGVGEQVFSMWVNVSDSCLSVLLVVTLLPKFGLAGYTAVIILMELYNFLLSAWRLSRKVHVSPSAVRCVLIPIIASALSVLACRALFLGDGAAPTVGVLLLKVLPALSILFALLWLFLRIFDRWRDFRRKRAQKGAKEPKNLQKGA